MALLALLLVIGTGAIRLLPHLPNFAPVGALALFSGRYFSKRWGWMVPIIAMVLSDLIIGFDGLRMTMVIYGSFLVTLGMGTLLQKKPGAAMVALGTLASSLFFFMSTNLAVWLFSPLYPKTLDGLLWCYAAALPFFRNTLLSDFFYTTLFFGSYALYQKRSFLAANLQKKPVTV
jgi:hypothetical protein